MFAIIGIVVVFGAIVAGYLMEHGKLLVLMQPAELVIIFGAAGIARASLDLADLLTFLMCVAVLVDHIAPLVARLIGGPS